MGKSYLTSLVYILILSLIRKSYLTSLVYTLILSAWQIVFKQGLNIDVCKRNILLQRGCRQH